MSDLTFDILQDYVNAVQDSDVKDIGDLWKKYNSINFIEARIKGLQDNKEALANELNRVTNEMTGQVMISCSSLPSNIPDMIRVRIEEVGKELCNIISDMITNVDVPKKTRSKSKRSAPLHITSFTIEDQEPVEVNSHTGMIQKVVEIAVYHARSGKGNEDAISTIRGWKNIYFLRVDENLSDEEQEREAKAKGIQQPILCKYGWVAEGKFAAIKHIDHAKQILTAVGIKKKITFCTFQECPKEENYEK